MRKFRLREKCLTSVFLYDNNENTEVWVTAYLVAINIVLGFEGDDDEVI